MAAATETNKVLKMEVKMATTAKVVMPETGTNQATVVKLTTITEETKTKEITTRKTTETSKATIPRTATPAIMVKAETVMRTATKEIIMEASRVTIQRMVTKTATRTTAELTPPTPRNRNRLLIRPQLPNNWQHLLFM